MTNTKIEIKNVKHNEYLSEETHCFDASLYFDGKRCATVSNRGHGGCNDYRIIDQNAYDALNAHVKTLPQTEFGGKMFDEDLDTVIGGLVNDFLIAKDFKRLKRTNAVCLNDNNQIVTTGYRGNVKPDQRLFDHCEKDGLIVLNNMPLNEVVELFKAAA
ncbi:hypothetical protein OAV22_02075 [Flavobacteriaceae bacterium]|nr:hypothetical protein [Flavobacteriaceae bacterium]